MPRGSRPWHAAGTTCLVLVYHTKTYISRGHFRVTTDAEDVAKRKDLLGWIKLIENRSPRGWSVMIMPQEIRIDNFHGPLHIHPPAGRSQPEPVAERSIELIREIIRRHAQRYQTISYKELVEELQ
jgi:hypothetical protein